jgi:ADP-dependent phosphofructokinase/glucokinase
MEEYWNKKYSDTTKKFKGGIYNVGPVFVAFNTNVDTIKYVDEKFLKLMDFEHFNYDEKLLEKNKNEIKTIDDFKMGLLSSMKEGKAKEWVINDMITYDYLKTKIKYDKNRIGGQAGIVANLLSNVGVSKIIVYNPKLSIEEAKMYKKNIKMPKFSLSNVHLVKPEDAVNSKNGKINLIFEFQKDMKVKTKNLMFYTARTNRFIISYRPKGRDPIFNNEIENNFNKFLSGVKRSFISGYQLLGKDEQALFKAKTQLSKIKAVNKDMKIHYEFTSEEDMELVNLLAKYVITECDSLGCNERETCILVKGLGNQKLAEDIKYSDYSAVKLYEAAKFIISKTKIKRVHIHNLGYMVCVFKKRYDEPNKMLDALLYSSELVLTKSMNEDIKNIDDVDINLNMKLSFRGLDELRKINKVYLKNKKQEGIFEFDNHFLIVVPMKEGENVKTTVGLGDTVSSIGFIGDLIK